MGITNIILIINLAIVSGTGQFFRNDRCRVRELQEPGRCVLIRNCPYALKLVHQYKYPQLCGFYGIDPIVCCPLNGIFVSTTTTLAPIIEPEVQSISTEKCKAYTAQPDAEPPISIGVGPSVIGGERASAEEFPHMAVLGYGDENAILWLCGGSLISEDYILTAAHCTYSQEYGDVKFVRLGDLNLKLETDDAQPQTFKVASIVRYPEYKPPIQYHDIALIKLDKPANFTKYVRPACLYTKQVLPEFPKAIATGWGKLGFVGDTSDDLMKVTLAYYTIDRCRQVYSNAGQRRLPNGISEDIQICAGGINESKDTCQGDSGGPLQIRSEDNYKLYHIVGVTSFGKGCGVINTPGVYTRVSNYVKWIEDDDCYVKKLQEEGRCVLIQNCSYALKLVPQYKHPQLCGFCGIDPIVCCPLNDTIVRKVKLSVPKLDSKVLSISSEKCKAYTAESDEVDADSDLNSTNVAFVAGGNKALPKEFLHMAALGYGDENAIVWNCGGSLISENYILTAAHCTYSQEYGYVKFVRLGDLNLKLDSDDEEPQSFKVTSIVRHPEYKPPIYYHDIALIKLDKPANFTEYVRPACLYTKQVLPEFPQPIATGWGKLGFLSDTSDDLMKVTLHYYTIDDCKMAYSNAGELRLPNGISDDIQICAGGFQESKDTCPGDSGGPLHIGSRLNYKVYYIIGVTSFGKFCGSINTPGVYTRVSSYVKWIESVWRNSTVSPPLNAGLYMLLPGATAVVAASIIANQAALPDDVIASGIQCLTETTKHSTVISSPTAQQPDHRSPPEPFGDMHALRH
ncbi:hypothetical protein FQR65_LT04027 [Abscondita terminalis]|nr:hypothetical protein FQR65_LT04027 [Abscondita terminalis]